MRFCLTKPKFLGKISFGKKRRAMVKMAPKQSIFDFLRKLNQYFCLA